MSCGPGKGLSALTDKIDSAKESVGNLVSDAEQGIAGAIDNLDSTLNDAAGNIAAKVKGLMPSIELPELAIPDFESLLPELPELKIPEKLQDAMSKVTKFANDPLSAFNINDPSGGIDAQLKSISDKFGLDVSKFKDKIMSGELSIDNICKLVPNVEKSPNGETITKGAPATAPETDAEKSAEPGPLPEIKTGTSEELKKIADELDKKLKATFEQTSAQVESLKNNLAIPDIKF